MKLFTIETIPGQEMCIRDSQRADGIVPQVVFQFHSRFPHT